MNNFSIQVFFRQIILFICHGASVKQRNAFFWFHVQSTLCSTRPYVVIWREVEEDLRVFVKMLLFRSISDYRHVYLHASTSC